MSIIQKRIERQGEIIKWRSITKSKKYWSLLSKKSGWEKELNIVNWHGKGGKFDIREWSPEHDRMGKCITLSEDELFKLYELLKEYFHLMRMKKEIFRIFFWNKKGTLGP